jgi:hypothetical protein
MIYQLPNGKVIILTLEEYLNLDDLDYGSVIKKKQRPDPESNTDKTLDYQEDDPDKSHGDNLGEDEIILDDISDFPDQIIDE